MQALIILLVIIWGIASAQIGFPIYTKEAGVQWFSVLVNILGTIGIIIIGNLLIYFIKKII
jgi:hypothetical protein